MSNATHTQPQAKTLPQVRRQRYSLSLSNRRLISRTISYTILIVGAVIMIFPLFWMLTASFKPEWQILTQPPIWIPSEWQHAQAGDTAKDFPLWYTTQNGEKLEVIEIGTRRYTTAVDVTQIEELESIPADQLGTAAPKTVGNLTLNVRSWPNEGKEVVALARDGDNLVVAPVDSLLDRALRIPLDELNAGKRANNEVSGFAFMGRELETGSIYIQVGPETQLTVVAPQQIADAAVLVNEAAPVNPEFVPIGGTELEIYDLKDQPEGEKYALLSLEAWQPILDMDEALDNGYVVNNDQLKGERETRTINDASMVADTVTLDDNTTEEVLILVERTNQTFVLPVDEADTLRLAPVSKGLGEPFVRTVDGVPLRYVDDYEEGRDKIEVVVVGERTTHALMVPQSAISGAFDVDSKTLERVLKFRLRFENYTEALSKNLGGATFLTFFRNSALIVLLNIIGHYFSVVLVAYAFARLRAPGKNVLFIILLSTMMLPFPVLLIPTYEIFNKFGMLNTLWPLFIRSFFGNAFLIFLLRQFFTGIPRELEEASRIDGANTFQVLWHIMLPLSKPALATIGIFTFWWNWNAFLEPFVYVNNIQNFTVSLGLAFFKGQYVYNFHWLMAAGMVAILPMILIFFFAQRYFIEGIQMTGLKG